MFHYVQSIQNTRGDALIGFFVKAVDPDTGSVVDIYADESSTPIVTVSGVANAAEVDSDGNVSFYVESGEYHLDIYATDSDTFVKRVENVPMITPSDFITDAVLADTGGAALVGTSGGGTVQDAVDRIGTFVGYDSGGSITQLTSKGAAVALNTRCGEITMHNTSLAANTAVSFTLNNSSIGPNDGVLIWIKGGISDSSAYLVRADGSTGGEKLIILRNLTGGALGEAIILGFAVVAAAVS